MCWQQLSELGGVDVSTMSEDCLFLNVFRPVATTTDSSRRDARPVFVYIHGGGFVSGSSSFYVPGQLVADGNIITVTLNYRLGAFGFLSSGDSRLPGNYALWDQQLAIRWVKDNIQAFGGDPNQITVGGESAGSISVAFQSLSPLSKGLFNRAIMQSGAATAGSTQRESLQQLLNLAREVRCPLPGSSLPSGGVSSDQDLLTCLRNVSPADIMTVKILGKSLIRAITEIVYAAVVDGEIIPKEPAAMLKDKEYLTQVGFYERDYLSGSLNNEGGVIYSSIQSMTGNVSLIVNPNIYDLDFVPFLTETRLGRRSSSAEEVIPTRISPFNFATSLRDKLMNTCLSTGATQLDMKQVLDTVGDVTFYVPGKEFARAIAGGQRSDRRNLAYFFDHYPTFVSGGQLGSLHGVDLIYEFDLTPSVFGNASLWNADDEYLRKVFIAMIAGFVQTGKVLEVLARLLNTRLTTGVIQLDFKHVLDTVGDSIFYVPGKEFTRATAGGQRPLRKNLAYFFDHYPAFAGGQVGTMHGTDLVYEFDMGRQNGWNADDDHLRKVFLGMIAGFVETGNPATALQSYLPGGWRDFDLRDESYLSLKPHALTIQQHLRGRAASLWIDLLPKLLDSDLSQRNHTSTHVPTLSELIG
ncbi:hypothetical protein C0Q70_03855 [Pomacea canaliculata]|uniref:Carboxylic ester hydrolase n=1 Tax=Pomacea canaliculata TaxID=400727 RepID=A0A2T7PTW5_POMCA|nr:hypothetical protein C0Q70_03855 [Pomacea canaliculata]